MTGRRIATTRRAAAPAISRSRRISARAWEVNLGGKLSAMTIADGKAFVSQVDAHTLHALDAATGKPAWHFIAGGRIDSPPTYWKGRVIFGGKDGWVYCLRASDGALIWRFQAAPKIAQHGAFEQIESVWPVHGSVLVENDTVNCVAGRSVLPRWRPAFHPPRRGDRARSSSEVVYDDKDPETGGDFQDPPQDAADARGAERHSVAATARAMYLRSQKIDADGKRIEIGPISANAAEQGGAQKGDGRPSLRADGLPRRLVVPPQLLGLRRRISPAGTAATIQAGKYTPEGRILVHDDKNVYGYARVPQYYKWTTTMEHTLFSASKDAPDVAPAGRGRRRKRRPERRRLRRSRRTPGAA